MLTQKRLNGRLDMLDGRRYETNDFVMALNRITVTINAVFVLRVCKTRRMDNVTVERTDGRTNRSEFLRT